MKISRLLCKRVSWATLVLVTALLTLTPLATMSEMDPSLGQVVATYAFLPQDTATIDAGLLSAKTGDSRLEPVLTKLYAAQQSGDVETQEALAGQRHIDLKAKSARVILEMDRSPEARPKGAPVVEVTTLESGQELRIVHAPPIAIRSDLAEAIAATGATYETAHADSVQVLAPFASLQGLAGIPGVRNVRLPFPAQPQELPSKQSTNGLAPLAGSQTSQAVALTEAATWHAAGYDGTGINVAIFDFGFTGHAALQASGDLPSTLYVYDWSSSYDFTPDTPGYDHGASCAEIAYDMAPDSTVHLFAFDTSTDLANAVSHYINNVSGAKVGSMSIGYLNAGPYDGTGAINDIVDGAQAAGIFWAQSAGNYRKQHWSGISIQYGTDDFVDWSGTGAGNVNFYGPEPGSAWNLQAGTEISAFLEWNDWNATRTGNQNHIDYEMGLYWLDGSTWTLVADSVRDQCTLPLTPVEAIEYTAANTGFYALGVWRWEGAGFCPNPFGHWLSLYSFTGIFQSGTGADHTFAYHNECNSVAIPADGDSAVAVGATFWNEDATAPEYGLESFTSLGPRNAAGGASPGVTVNKPDVVSPDGVDTSTTGPNDGSNYANGGGGFWGTSAAAAHVAGLAALVWEKNPSYTLAQVRQGIQNQALYKGDGGSCGGSLLAGSQPESSTQNNRFGWGRINYTAYETVAADFAASPTSGVAPLSVAFTNESTGDYDSCAWTFGDGGTSNDCQDTNHLYGASGIFTVSLAVSGLGGTDALTRTNLVTAYEAVAADFAASPTSGVAPLTVAFTNESTGDYDNCAWTFGDSGTSSDCQDTNHLYGASGIFTVSLAVSGPGGTDALTRTNLVTAYEAVAASFVSSPTSGVVPLTVVFTNTSTGDYDSSLWDFGDEVTSTLESPIHTYTVADVYTVTLTVGGPGGSEAEVKRAYIVVRHEYAIYLPIVLRPPP